MLAALLLAPLAASSQERGTSALADQIAGLGTTMRVLVIAAHPDDEDTRLITWLTKGHRAEVAYLSLTRGDGGQNLIGNELGEALGAIRTEELLTARRLDGAHQYFTRAYDFGFSKSAEETYKHWPHDSLLKDVVTIVRAFRPNVIVSVFSGTPRDGHGQHQVSAILAREAYDAAGDSVRFPAKSTQGLAPWTVSKFYRDRTYWGPPFSYQFDAGDYDPVIGLSYAELAVISRSQHRSQGTGALPRKGPAPGYLMREATRVNAGTDSTKETSIFDGIAGASLAYDSASRKLTAQPLPMLVATLRSKFDPWDPEATSADVLCRIGAQGDARAASRALLLTRGVAVEATVDRDLLAIGDSIPVAIAVYDRGRKPLVRRRDPAPTVRGDAVSAVRGPKPAPADTIAAGRAAVDTVWIVGRQPSRPWWLERPRTGDIYAVPAETVAEDLRDPFAFAVAHVAADGCSAAVEVPVVHRFADPVKGGMEHPLMVAPAVTLTLDTQVEYVPANARIDRTVHVRLRSAATAARAVKVSLTLPKGLAADSAARTVQLPALGTATAEFHVRGSLAAGSYAMSAAAESGGQTFTTGYQLIDYDHIRPQTLYRDATVTLQAVDVVIPPGANVAYIPGTNDNSIPALQQLGIPLTVLDPATLAGADLRPYTTIVIGPRAYETSPQLVANNARLLDWVKGGGTLVVQYGQYEMTQPGMMPYPVTLTRPAARVTEEDAAVTVLAPNDPLLNAPNRIGAADWKGWVQDFALYMPTTWDPAYTALVSMHDAGEPPVNSGILVAPYGRGTYVYTTLAFFRQLPAGVPGAARLFVNLLGARQAGAPRTTP
ncbi:MAG TPA: PIG-L family deacetylase [Gemmatimonadaceae bacterium]|nr:PIG-L family deacetylase [Gemmatimonadaceae bacterium]